jgi:choline-sulfatase
MNRRAAFACLVSVVLASLAHVSDAAAAAARKPNIIAIVTDDQGRWSIGAYGNKDARTPNMDRLAKEGALFVNAFVNTPVCSPSRASYLTGLHGTQVGITDWINVNESAQGVGLPPGTTTWPEVLKQNGYATALVGKWHLGSLPQHHPTKHGYDHFWGFPGGGTEPMDPQVEVDGKRVRLKGPVPDLLTDEAMRWIEANRDKPFALSMHFREPHLPYGPVPAEDSAPFEDADVEIPQMPKILNADHVKDLTRRYYASVHAVDRNLGRLLVKLDELKLADDTIILFTSDHGYNVGHHGVHGKGNGNWIGGGVAGPKRPNMYESSIRVPLLVRWPGVVKPGTSIEQPVMNLDTFASVLGMAGVAAPPGVKQNGRDFSPLLRGEPAADWRTDVFGQYDLHNAGLAYMRMIRAADGWKLVRHHMTNGRNELFDLTNDPGERKNLYYNENAAEVRDKLQERLTAWERTIDDPILKLDADRPIEPGPPVGQ